MFFPASTKPTFVSQVGADADSILCGGALNNHGLRVRILQAQPRGNSGPIQGSFILLDAGDNRHAETLTPFLGKVTDAREVLTALRQQSPACVHVVNASALTVEAKRAEGMVSDPDGAATAVQAGKGAHPRLPNVFSDPDA